MSIRTGYLLPTRERIMAGRPQAAPLLELAERAERLGFDSVWAGDSLLARPRHAGTTGTDMDKDYLALKRASASRPSGHWYDDGYDVLCKGEVVGRIMKAAAAPVGQPWMWTLVLYHEGRTPTHGYEPTREAAMAAFAKSWRRE